MLQEIPTGNWADFQQKEFKKLKKGDYLLVCGDFGFFWNSDKSEQKALKWLSRQKYTILLWRGPMTIWTSSKR